MKVFNKSRVTKLQIHWPIAPNDHDPEVDGKFERKLYEFLPGQSINVDDDLAAYVMKGWGHIIITDDEANKMVAASRAEIEAKDKLIAELEGKLKETESAVVSHAVTIAGQEGKITALEQAQADLEAKDSEIADLKAALASASKKASRATKAAGGTEPPIPPAEGQGSEAPGS